MEGLAHSNALIQGAILIVIVFVFFLNDLMCVLLCISRLQARKAEPSLNIVKKKNLV